MASLLSFHFNSLQVFHKVLPYSKKPKSKGFSLITELFNSLPIRVVAHLKVFLFLFFFTNASLFNLSYAAPLHHKENRSAGLFSFNNFTDLSSSSSSSSPSAATAMKSMDLTSVELNSIDVGEYDTGSSSSRNLQLGTKENTGKFRLYVFPYEIIGQFTYGVPFSTKKCALFFKKCNFVFVS